MGYVLSRIRSGTLRTLCEPKDVGYSCNFSKSSPNPRILVHHILDSSRSIESPIGLAVNDPFVLAQGEKGAVVESRQLLGATIGPTALMLRVFFSGERFCFI